MPTARTPDHYNAMLVAVHWLTAVLIVASWCVGQFHDVFPKGPARATAMFIHNSTGLAVVVLLLARIAVRLASKSPQGRIVRLGPFGERATAAGHGVLYLLMIAVPVSGIVLQFARGDALSIVGLSEIASPWARDRAFSRSVREVHEVFANALLIVALLHATAGLAHHYWLRDETLRRMMPWIRPLPSGRRVSA